MRTDYAKHNSIDRTRLRLQSAGAAIWLGAICASGAWMLHGGGFVRPVSVFAACVAVLALVFTRALAKTSNEAPTPREVAMSLRYTGYSVIVLLLGTLFLEYWPVTVTMAFMFAICRSFEDEDTPAYV